MRGRKPGSKKVHDLHAGKLRVIKSSIQSSEVNEDADVDENIVNINKQEAPDWISHPLARELWEKLLPELLLRKQYLSIFEVELGRYCIAYAQYRLAIAAMEKAGGAVVKSTKGVEMLSQHWVVANRAHETLLRLAADLGLNPVAQVRIEGHQFDLFNLPNANNSLPQSGIKPANPFSEFRRPN